ncbi:MerC domain-containing protein [Botrimarina hoheduenensis]|uniref:MerC mercury resistance protein n=1 Tax=Botrimarina hoheduenensis TaxID=2528000 RepID=A0A5C5VXG9_9BACT|nr:MerC domain-containing protein [Botrimarina hoheduenensis]TWT43130.1 MerC mercury resistance protein [Botrimarina hoheduenensis]
MPCQTSSAAETRAVASRAAWGDAAGIAASVACAVHCALVPVTVGYLPALGLSWVAGKGFHQGMTALCFAVAVLAFAPGFRKHGKIAPALLGLLGVGLLAIEAFGVAGLSCAACLPGSQTAATGESLLSRYAVVLPPMAGVILVAAHLLNHRYACLCCKSGHQHPHEG